MADIQVNGISLELPRDYEIPFEIRSGWFTSDLVKDLSMTFSLPWQDSPVNRKALSDLDIPQAIIESDRVLVTMELGGIYRAAEMVFRALDIFLEVNLYFNKVELACLNLRPGKISLPNPEASLEDLYTKGVNDTWPATEVYFPEINNPIFYDDADTDPADKLNANFGGIINVHDTGTGLWAINTAGAPPNNENTLCPQPALLGILTRFFAQDGYNLDGDFFRDPEARRLFAYNNRSLDIPISNFNMLATAPYNQFTLPHGFQKRLNVNVQSGPGFSDVTKLYTVQNEGEFRATVLGKVTSVDFMEVVMKFDGVVMDRHVFNTTTSGQLYVNYAFNWQVADIGKLVEVYVTPTLAGTHSIYIENLSFTITSRVGVIAFENPDDLATFYPRMRFANLLNAVLQAFSLKMRVHRETKTIFLSYKTEALVGHSQKDLTPYFTGSLQPEFFARERLNIRFTAPSQFEEDFEEYRRQLVIEKDGSLNWYLGAPPDFEGETLNLAIHPLLEATRNLGITGSLRGRGLSPVLTPDASQEDKLRLAYYTGFYNNRPRCRRSYGSSSLELDFLNNSIGARLIRWRQFFNADNRWYTASFLMPLHTLMSLNPETRVAINTIKLIIDHIKFTDKNDSETEVEMRLKRI